MINLSFAPNENSISAANAAWQFFWPFNFYATKPLKDAKEILGDITKTSPENIFLLLSARSSLFLFLQSLHLPKNSEVIVQAFTCEAVVLPIIAAHLKPIYGDIEKESFSLNFESFTSRLTRNTIVVILQHTFGMIPRDRKKIIDLCEEKNIIVIEDLAHGFQAEIFNDKNVKNSIKIFSFGRSKLFSVTHGGAISIPSKVLKNNFDIEFNSISFPNSFFVIKALLYKMITPAIKATSSSILGKLLHKVFIISGLFSNEISAKEKEGMYDSWLEKKLPGALAACLNPQLLQYKKIIENSKKIAEYYSSELGDISLFKSLPILRYPILVLDPHTTARNLKKNGIIVGDWYQQPVAPKQLDLKKVFYTVGSCPVAEKICTQILNLPLLVSEAEAHTIITILKADHD